MQIPEKLVAICQMLSEKRATDITVFDSSKRENDIDYFVVATLSSSAHVKGVAEDFVKLFGEEINREGFNLSGWVALDFDDAIIHLFTKAERAKYGMDRLLADGGRQESFKKIQKEILAKQQKELLQQKSKKKSKN